MTYVNCTEIPKFKPLEFMFDQYYLPINPNEYIYDPTGDNNICALLIMPSQYDDIFILGQPLFQGFYSMHDLQLAQIKFAPLRNSLKKTPTKSRIPNQVLQADAGPSFLNLYGSFGFMMFCVVFATYVYHPWLAQKWDINDTSNEWKFVVFYFFYVLGCVVVYVYLLAPFLGLPSYSLESTSLSVVGAGVSALAIKMV